MKIAIDGFALGIPRGTGITRYAVELSRVLAERHQVFPVYGLNGIGGIPDLKWPRFIQSLIVRGEAKPSEVARWAGYCALYFPSYLIGRPIRAKEIICDKRIDISSISDHLPSYAKVYNVPSVYRSVQAYSLVFSHPLRLHLDDKVDIWHGTLPMPIKVAGAKWVVTAHDVVPLVLPHSTTINLRHYRRMVWQSYKSADMIFAISEHTKRDLISYFGIPEHRVFITHQSADIPANLMAPSREAVSTFLQAAFGLDYGNYFLFYGAIEPKKNIGRLIEAICAAQTDLPIVIAGKRGWLDDGVAALIEQHESGAQGRRKIVRIDYLPFDHLMFLLKGARGLVFPSLYEGFGIPLLEAMLMGCPIITSNSTSPREICGDAAMYVDPLNVRQIADAIDVLATDRDLGAELVRRGKVQADRFSRERYLAKLEEGYRFALEA
ncbi:MAG: glycosyltransferase family 4 protein [Xanthobacteraceae bacterium]|nr:glycosyltransferase family 4 protein [Xanthobacteraceae bacterium]